jgi:ubiquinone/menaquinone biosynthesis C-methylase UbiE
MFSKLIAWLSDQPALFLFLRGVLENDFRAIRTIIARDLPGHSGARTLDLGCGPGAFSTLFDPDKYVGVDLNPRYIAYARQHFKGQFLAGDARCIESADRAFDQVLVFGLLHHLEDAAVSAVLTEMRRVLRAGGRALVIEDIPAVSQLNLLGHLTHYAENGEHIRAPEAYQRLYTQIFHIERDETLRSGICDYYAAVLTAL